ncbi:MAG: hypothetical protein PHF60_04615 [Candidatus ainarchaeum sp.]|nr:hypothetical protein [Candidatus ainarchaeum sp.]
MASNRPEAVDPSKIPGALPPGVKHAQETMARFFRANAGRSQLTPALIGRLDEIRKAGNDMLNDLQPHSEASVFKLNKLTAEHADLVRRGVVEPEGTLNDAGERVIMYADLTRDQMRIRVSRVVAEVMRKGLDDAQPFMEAMFERFPHEDKDLETTSVLCSLLALSGIARYVPDIIIESMDDAAVKQELAKKFIAFYEARLEGKLNRTQKLSISPKEFHSDCFSVYNDFKKEFSGLFQQLRERLWSSRKEFMAPYGDGHYGNDWPEYHYKGKF